MPIVVSMKYENAIKKLTKAGFTTVKSTSSDRLFVSRKAGLKSRIEFRTGGDGRVSSIRSIYAGDNDDIHTDYCAGVFCDNITQAIAISK